jgi:membrane-bound ClpP family serine protease
MMNLRLFLLLLLIEIVFVVTGYFGLIFFVFFYFGSGSGASSPQAQMTQKVWVSALALLPLLFGIYKYKRLKDQDKANSYLFAGLCIAITSAFLIGT